MNCPICTDKALVGNTIYKRGKIFRYYKCKSCQHKFKTIEMLAEDWNYKAIVMKIKEMVEEL